MPSSSRPYQSKILSFILSQFQQGVERHRRAVRQVRSAAAWGVQVALSPIYAVMRAARLAGRQLGQGPAKRLPLLGWFRRSSSETEDGVTQQSATSEASMPEATAKSITQILEVAQQCLEPEQKSALRLTVPVRVNWLSQLWQPQVDSEKLGTLEGFQGIASDVETRAIVLVRQGNQVWSGLTVAQQSFLLDQIWALVNAEDSADSTFASSTNSLRWRLSSASPGGVLGWLRGKTRRPMLVLEGEVTSEALITQFLADIQRVLPAEQRSQCLPAAGSLVATKGALHRQAPTSSMLGQPGLLQGIASDRETQALVLVGAENVVWDVLTPHQQTYLKQQIWALMEAYWRYQHQAFDVKQQVIAWLPLPDRWKQFLSQQFEGSRQETLSGAQTVQGNLVVQTVAPSASLSPTVKGRGWIGSKVWFANIFAGLIQGSQAKQLQSAEPKVGFRLPWQRPAVPLPRRWRQTQALPDTVQRVSAPLAAAQSSASLSQTSVGGIFNRYSLPESHYLETEVTSMEYVEHPLEKLLRWIDGVLSWLEALWRRFVAWVSQKVSHE